MLRNYNGRSQDCTLIVRQHNWPTLFVIKLRLCLRDIRFFDKSYHSSYWTASRFFAQCLYCSFIEERNNDSRLFFVYIQGDDRNIWVCSTHVEMIGAKFFSSRNVENTILSYQLVFSVIYTIGCISVELVEGTPPFFIFFGVFIRTTGLTFSTIRIIACWAKASQ